MDSANTQTAIVAELVQGTIVTAPAFLVLRDSRVTGTPQRSSQRAPERVADRMAHHMVTGLNAFPKAVEMAWMRDDAADVLLESLLCNAWSTNTLRNASTEMPFTLEQKYEGGGTDPYRRLAGCIVDNAAITFGMDGAAGSIVFNLVGLAETMATAQITLATYTQPTPDYDPVSAIYITVNSLFSLASPKVMSLNMTITNNVRAQYAFGSASPWGTGLGMFDISGQVSVYFQQAADYSAFMERQTGMLLDLIIGSQASGRDRIELKNCDVWNPDIDDPGQTGDHMLTLNFMARAYVSDSSAITWTRNY